MFTSKRKNMAAKKSVVIAMILASGRGNNDINRPVVPMSEYEFNYRTLSCWECFEAQGRMCHHDGYDHGEIYDILESANKGYGVCCKNDV